MRYPFRRGKPFPECLFILFLLSVFRREIDRNISAEQFRSAVCLCVRGESFSDFAHQFKSHILMRHLPAAESQSYFEPEFLFQEIYCPVQLRFIIVLIDIDTRVIMPTGSMLMVHAPRLSANSMTAKQLNTVPNAASV